MNVDLEELKRCVRDGQIKAVTLDTNIFHKYNFNFESGLLHELEQFSDDPVDLIISKIVKEEIISELIKRAKEINNKIRTSLEEAQKNLLISSLDFETVNILIFEQSNFNERVFDRFENFVDSTSLHIIDNSSVNIDDLLYKYFNNKPPFKEIKNKKYEFPDAIALMSLEGWANDNQTNVIVISNDNDWEQFCEKTTNLIYVDDLAKALELFQDPSLDDVCKYLSEKYEEGEGILNDKIRISILETLNDQICNFIELDTDYSVSVSITDFEFKPFENLNILFRLIDSNDTTLVVMSELIVDANFCFGTLGDYEHDEELDVSILISFCDCYVSHGVIDLQDLSIEVNINNVLPKAIDMKSVLDGYEDECNDSYLKYLIAKD